ncbi:MAG: hypothetical protein FWD45_05740, partial [Coriobacteriia bacterium]|nr:hypothetical protein [Coriobacteriia bacterium]
MATSQHLLQDFGLSKGLRTVDKTKPSLTRYTTRIAGFILGLAVATTVAIALPAIAWAADDDVSNAVELAAKDGSASIVEHDTSDDRATGENKVSDLGTNDDLTFKNDLPSYTRETTENSETGEKSEQLYLTDGEQAITLPKDAPVPGADQITKTESDPVGNEKVTKEVIASSNAIQKAVEKALASLTSDSKSITIAITAGEYDGDITINRESIDAAALGITDLDEFLKQFTLFLVADDAYTKPAGEKDLIDQTSFEAANSKGLVNINGNIVINGVNVQVVGLFYSPGSTTTVENSTMTIVGTVKDDTIVVVVSGDTTVVITTGAGNDTVTISGKGDTAATTLESNSATINTGAGDDTVNIDISVANFISTINIDGGEGRNRVHFTGTLLKDSTNNSFTVDADEKNEIVLENSDSKQLKTVAAAIQDFTDELKNKPEIELKLEDATEVDGFWTFTLSNPFTNYILKVAEHDGFTVENTDGLLILGNLAFAGAGFLCNVIIQPGEQEYGVNSITADGLNLTIKGRQITFFGIVTAMIITVEAFDDDVNIKAKDTFIDNLPLPDGATDSLEVSLFDAYSKVVIKVAEGAELIATGSIFMTATIKQTHGFLPIAGINFVTVKVGNVEIIIDGKVIAGGRIQIKSELEVKFEVSNSTLAAIYIPLVVAVAVSDSGVIINEKAVILAGASVEITAVSNITITAKATTGKLPLAIAVGVVVSDTYVEVYGSIKAETTILIAASGTIKVIAAAQGKTAETKETTGTNDGKEDDPKDTKTGSEGNSYGGFVAVTVVLQDVWVKILDNASLTAGGDITLRAKADERVTTKAISSDPNASKGGDGKSDSSGNTTKQITDMLGGVFKTLKESMTGDKNKDKMDKAGEGLASTEGNKINAGAEENGAVSTPSRAKSGETVNIKVTPNEGYKLGTLTITYLAPGDTTKTTTTITAVDGKYSFTMPDAEVTIKATFVELAAGETPPATGNDNTGNKGVNATDALDGATKDADGNDTDSKSFGSKYTLTAYQGKDSSENSLGAIIPETDKADDGQTVTITVNPASGKQLKEGTLVAKYTLDGVEHTLPLNKDANGKYTLLMPAANVTFTAEFEDKDPNAKTDTSKKSESGNTSSNNLTGALAVAVVSNNNQVIVNIKTSATDPTTGIITTDGELKIEAIAITQNSLIADASPVKAASAKPAGETKKEEDPDKPKDEIVAEQKKTGVSIVVAGGDTKQYDVTIAATKNGRVTMTDGQFIFTLAPQQGYLEDTVKISYTDNKGEKQSATLTRQANG